MRPRQDLVSTGYCLAEPGQQYLVFLPNPQALDVKNEGGSFTVEWINARDGNDRRQSGKTSTGSNLTPPAHSGEWLLWLVRDQ